MKRLLLVAALASCAPDVAPSPPDDAGQDGPPAHVYGPIEGGAFFVGDDQREANVIVPGDYDPTEPLPFVLLLHGYGITGAQMDQLTGFRAFANQERVIYASPDGTVDSQGENFWHANATCCDFDGTNVDDAAFLRGIVLEAAETANIDPARVFVLGHSNGGFMAHRLACDSADLFTAIVSIAGATTTDGCEPSEGVAVLQVHGTADATIAYAGGSFAPGFSYPGAEQTAQLWAARNACAETPTAGGALDLESGLAGAETTVARYEDCESGGAAELWTSEGGGHVPNANASWLPTLYGFLADHPRE
jgi:polyhydroxybutyrate depolymerase